MQGLEVHYLSVLPQPDEVVTPAETVLHRFDSLGRRGLRDAVADLSLNVLLLNPERSRRYRGIRADVLRSAYGTEHYRQKLRSFHNRAERVVRRALRVTPWEMAERRWERAFYEGHARPPHVIAQSGYMRAQILESYRIPADHVHVIHNAVDTREHNPETAAALRDEMRQRWGIQRDALCLLFLGHNFRLKGLWRILALMPRLTDPNRPVHLLVAGRGTGAGQRDKAAKLVSSLGLKGRVSLAGEVRPSLHALAAADCLIHLSWHDSFGFAALEAMACGLPVITTPYVGAAELIDHGVSGLVVDPSDDEAVIAAIDALRDEPRRVAMGSAAAAIAATRDEPTNFAEVLEVFRAAASGR
jgi:UDP-glucose:(heptosyl)LPS alpha-1,3-glucosyltransferase